TVRRSTSTACGPWRNPPATAQPKTTVRKPAYSPTPYQPSPASPRPEAPHKSEPQAEVRQGRRTRAPVKESLRQPLTANQESPAHLPRTIPPVRMTHPDRQVVRDMSARWG